MSGGQRPAYSGPAGDQCLRLPLSFEFLNGRGMISVTSPLTRLPLTNNEARRAPPLWLIACRIGHETCTELNCKSSDAPRSPLPQS